MTRTSRLVLSLLIASTAAIAIDVSEVSADAPTGTAEYTVKSGDSLITIARRFGIRLAVLLELNELTITSVIHPGDSLYVPATSTAVAPASAATPAPAATTASALTPYTVQRGDALTTIAARHGVTLKALLTANKLQLTSTIIPGRVLQIPPATKPIPAAPTAAAPVATATVASTGTANPTPAATPTPTPTDVLVDFLKAQVGKPYKFFTAGPDTYDCSGLVVAGYRQIGVELIHQSGSLAKVGREVDLTTESIVAGDVIVLSSPTDPTVIAHVGVAVSGTSWIQAVGPGIPVKISALPTSRIVTVRRIIGQ